MLAPDSIVHNSYLLVVAVVSRTGPAAQPNREADFDSVEGSGVTMSIEENKAVVQRIWKELIIEGRTESVDELIASDYAYHGSGGFELRGREGFRQYLAWLHTSFPDLQCTLDDIIAEGEKIVTFYTAKATHKTNKPVRFQGVTISRLADGKEVEAWDLFDVFEIALQLAPGWANVLLRLIQKQMVKDRP